MRKMMVARCRRRPAAERLRPRRRRPGAARRVPVARQAPLVIPPDYALVPPQAGAARPQDAPSNAQTLEALFGGRAEPQRGRAQRGGGGGRRHRRSRHPLHRGRSGDQCGRQGRDHARHRRGARGRWAGREGERFAEVTPIAPAAEQGPRCSFRSSLRRSRGTPRSTRLRAGSASDQNAAVSETTTLASAIEPVPSWPLLKLGCR